jgi:hypothetical protein
VRVYEEHIPVCRVHVSGMGGVNACRGPWRVLAIVLGRSKLWLLLYSRSRGSVLGGDRRWVTHGRKCFDMRAADVFERFMEAGRCDAER